MTCDWTKGNNSDLFTLFNYRPSLWSGCHHVWNSICLYTEQNSKGILKPYYNICWLSSEFSSINLNEKCKKEKKKSKAVNTRKAIKSLYEDFISLKEITYFFLLTKSLNDIDIVIGSPGVFARPVPDPREWLPDLWCYAACSPVCRTSIERKNGLWHHGVCR